jgi:hypothetical protein
VREQHYGLDPSHDDRALLEKKASTENLVNAAAQQTGKIRKDEHIDVHGDDASFREVKDGQQPWAEPMHTALGMVPSTISTGYDIAEVFAEEAVHKALGAASDLFPLVGMANEVRETSRRTPSGFRSPRRLRSNPATANLRCVTRTTPRFGRASTR